MAVRRYPKPVYYTDDGELFTDKDRAIEHDRKWHLEELMKERNLRFDTDQEFDMVRDFILNNAGALADILGETAVTEKI